jgi:hypothetical protein
MSAEPVVGSCIVITVNGVEDAAGGCLTRPARLWRVSVERLRSAAEVVAYVGVAVAGIVAQTPVERK